LIVKSRYFDRGPTAVRRAVAVAAAVLVAASMSSCSSDDTQTQDPTVSSVSTQAVGETAPWARDVVTGDQLWQASTEGMTLTAYAMGLDTSEFDSHFSDDDTGEPLVRVGDSILFVNLVLTNNGNSVQYLSTRQPTLLALPRESPYRTQSVAEITMASSAQWASHNVSFESVRQGSGVLSPFPLSPGESCARGFILPLDLGREWAFGGAVFVYSEIDDRGNAVRPGRVIEFETQYYTFE